MKLCEEAEGSIRRRRGIRPCNAREGGGGECTCESGHYLHTLTTKHVRGNMKEKDGHCGQ